MTGLGDEIRPDQGDDLLLAGGEVGAAHPDPGVNSADPADQWPEANCGDRFVEVILGGLRCQIREVLPEGASEDVGLLWDEADSLQRSRVADAPDVEPADANCAPLGCE